MDIKTFLGSGHLKNPIKVSEANANNFRGKWLAIIEERIVANHEDIGRLIDITRTYHKGKKAEFVRINKGNTAMY